MNKVAQLLELFHTGQLTKYQTEKELSSMLGGNWILSLINGEYVPVQYHDVEPELIDNTDDADTWFNITRLGVI